MPSHPLPTTPRPTIIPASQLRPSAPLEKSITALINTGYRYIAPHATARWAPDPSARLPSPDSLYRELGEGGFVAVIYAPDPDSQSNSDPSPDVDSDASSDGSGDVKEKEKEEKKVPVACAAAARWTRDLEGGGADDGEGGWEVKLVTCLGAWMGRGLGGVCVEGVVEELRRRERVERAQRDGERERDRESGRERDGEKERKTKLRIWVQTVECVNGAYWRKKGWVQVRAYEKPVGHWGSREGYRLLVLVKEVDV